MPTLTTDPKKATPIGGISLIASPGSFRSSTTELEKRFLAEYGISNSSWFFSVVGQTMEGTFFNVNSALIKHNAILPR